MEGRSSGFPAMTDAAWRSKLLITGATGFVGGALLEHLSGEAPLRALVRDAARLEAGAGIEVVEADLTDRDSLGPVLRGIDVACYLVHSMEAGVTSFADADRESAENFAGAAREVGLRRVVYLGGVSPADEGGDRSTCAHARRSRRSSSRRRPRWLRLRRRWWSAPGAGRFAAWSSSSTGCRCCCSLPGASAAPNPSRSATWRGH